MTGETYRGCVDARRTVEHGGGACALLVLRVADRVLLCHHAALSTGAQLTPQQAVEVGEMLLRAAGSHTSPAGTR
ncbi:MAG: hypothetical protein ACRDRZ_04140 [Pseudonocardiaceae bacterium]